MTINVYEIHYRGCWRHLASIDNRISISLSSTVRTTRVIKSKMRNLNRAELFPKSCLIGTQIVLYLKKNRAAAHFIIIATTMVYVPSRALES